jgi:hypothetical protein
MTKGPLQSKRIMTRDKHESQGKAGQVPNRVRKPRRHERELRYESNLILNQKSLDEELLNTESLSSTWNGVGSAPWDQTRENT